MLPHCGEFEKRLPSHASVSGSLLVQEACGSVRILYLPLKYLYSFCTRNCEGENCTMDDCRVSSWDALGYNHSNNEELYNWVDITDELDSCVKGK